MHAGADTPWQQSGGAWKMRLRAHGRADRNKHVWTERILLFVMHLLQWNKGISPPHAFVLLPPPHTPAQYLSSTTVSLLLAGIYPSLTDLHCFSMLQRPHSYPPLLSSPLPRQHSHSCPIGLSCQPQPPSSPPKGLDSVSDLSESHELTQALLDTHTLD